MPDWLWIQQVVFPLVGMAMGSFVLYGVYKTVNRHLDRRHEARLGGASGEVIEELARLRERLDLLDEQAVRVQELEERLDFAERIIARQQDRPVLGGEH